jgi:ATP/ADP translocase
MFNNSVFKQNVDTKKWLVNAGIRAVKTFAQTCVAMIPVSAMIQEVDWVVIASTAALSAVVSILTSIAGIPEVEAED